jgi:Ca-activated chloride channel family protein
LWSLLQKRNAIVTFCVNRKLPVIILGLALLRASQAQIPARVAVDQQFRFSTSVQMVVLQTPVLNSKGAFARNLRQGNFTAFEDARQQVITIFSHNDSPVAIGLIIDNSGSMRRKHSAVLAAAKAFARNSNPKDQLFIVNFNDKVTLGLAGAQPFSANSHDLERAIPPTAGGGKTALYDALEVALDHIHELKQDKKALILISDGGDNASSHTLEQVISDATNSDVVVYTIGLFGKDEDETNPAFMKRISSVTGGEAFLPARPGQAASNCKRIAQLIRSEYTLGYSPNNNRSNGAFRAIKVNVTTKSKEQLVARTRLGYTPSASVTTVDRLDK